MHNYTIQYIKQKIIILINTVNINNIVKYDCIILYKFNPSIITSYFVYIKIVYITINFWYNLMVFAYIFKICIYPLLICHIKCLVVGGINLDY